MSKEFKKDKKSVAAAVLLGLFLGPFGTFYTGWKVFLLFMVLIVAGLVGISVITSAAHQATMAEVVETDLDEHEALGYETGATIGAGLLWFLLALPYFGILGLSALITNVVSCQKHNNRVEKYLQEESERRHQEILQGKIE